MTNIATIIVDDEIKSRQGLDKMIREIEGFDLIASCKNGAEAIEVIDRLKPQLVLLDIQMPGISGFDVLKSIVHSPFIIFITAYDQYAIKAFEYHAIDYILKPFTDKRFFDALTNAKTLLQGKELNNSLASLQQMIDNFSLSGKDESISSNLDLGKFIFRTDGKVYLLEYDSIIRFEAMDYYVKVIGDKTYIIKESLKELLKQLPSKFIRVHKSSIINMGHLKRLESLGHSDQLAIMTNGDEIKVSRNYREVLDDYLSL